MIKALNRINSFVYGTCRNPYLKEDIDCYGKEIYKPL